MKITITLLLLILSIPTWAKNQHLVILRGLIRENAHSIALYKYLAQEKTNLIVHGLEIHGNGQYFKQDSALSVTDMVEQVRHDYSEIRKQYPAEDEFTLIAISLGGMIAADWTHRYPGDFNKLVLVNTSFSGVCSMFERFRPANLTSYLKLLVSTNAKSKEENIFELIIHQKEKNTYLIDEWSKIRNERPISIFNTLRQMFAGWRFSAPEAASQLPTWVMVGERDELVSPNCSYQIAKKWNLPILKAQNAGHDLTNDDPKWFIDEISQILNLN